ncbi:alpha/beta-hydrolase [Linderina pennispora]|uniref:Alpha/beta-hydrolase n=1 Tax=Linderina pennispora TaxID=61395 RepID=A0A1Y1W870_9FUNG|nr:alpha/beta-hydrolase [Linderina pennispora]ORX69709.1 alpha/beta-hydrolase [Linderina pennispora]
MDPLNPDSFNHKFATINGTTIHYVDEGTGPVILCFHGFPDLWYGWRKQIPYLVSLGYRVIAPDTHGYGQTDAPKDLKAYGAKNIVNDFVSLLDTLNIREAVWAGHDWGGNIAWRAALWHPERVIGVISYCTPYFLSPEKYIPLDESAAQIPELSYQLYFGRAETTHEFNKELPLLIRALFRPRNEFLSMNIFSPIVPVEQRTLTDVKGLELSGLLTQQQYEYYISELEKNGMEGPLNYYRVYQINWEDEHEAGLLMGKIDKPCMMVTAGYDAALPAEWVEHMLQFAPNMTQEHIKESGHWILNEQPESSNNAFAKFLKHLEDSGFVKK